MLTLGIETSCDETSCAVMDGKDRILSNIISSSLFRHKSFGGVVPEIASRHCLEQIDEGPGHRLQPRESAVADHEGQHAMRMYEGQNVKEHHSAGRIRHSGSDPGSLPRDWFLLDQDLDALHKRPQEPHGSPAGFR